MSLGACIVAVASLPLGYWNLEDNIVVQNVAMVIILVSMVLWFVIFGVQGMDTTRVPVVRTELGLSAFHGMSGTILFNFMFISTLPSWICEKKPNVLAMHVIIVTLIIAAIMFALVGILGGWAFPEFYTGDQTLLSEMHHIKTRSVKIIADVSVDAYAISSNLASIPIFSIMMRYNLIEQKITGPCAAGLVSVILPWCLSVIFYCGTGFQDVVTFAGSFTSSVVNLLVPSFLLIASQKLSRRTCNDVPLSASVGDDMDCSDAPVRDRSGHISSVRVQQRWIRIAWLNVVLMSVVTVAAIADQLANGDAGS
jgi:hypothetical protein